MACDSKIFACCCLMIHRGVLTMRVSVACDWKIFGCCCLMIHRDVLTMSVSVACDWRIFVLSLTSSWQSELILWGFQTDEAQLLIPFLSVFQTLQEMECARCGFVIKICSVD